MRRSICLLYCTLSAVSCGGEAPPGIETSEFEVGSRAVISGRVISSTGVPVLGAQVAYDLPTTRGTFIGVPAASAKDGTFRLEIGRLGSRKVPSDTVAGTIYVDYPVEPHVEANRYRQTLLLPFVSRDSVTMPVLIEVRLRTP